MESQVLTQIINIGIDSADTSPTNTGSAAGVASGTTESVIPTAPGTGFLADSSAVLPISMLLSRSIASRSCSVAVP